MRNEYDWTKKRLNLYFNPSLRELLEMITIEVQDAFFLPGIIFGFLYEVRLIRSYSEDLLLPKRNLYLSAWPYCGANRLGVVLSTQ